MRFTFARAGLAGLLALALAACGQQATGLGGSSRAALEARNAAHTGMSLIVEPDMGIEPILKAINGARKSIDLTMYMFTNKGLTNQIIQALVARQQAGVAVRVLIEPHPYLGPQPPGQTPPDVNHSAVWALTAGGVKVKTTGPRFTYTHEKSMVVDGTTAYIMTFNFTNTAFTSNREYAVVDDDAVDVSTVSQLFQSDWDQTIYIPTAPNLVVSPDNSHQKLLDLIDTARHDIAIECEVIGDQEIADHLGAKQMAGVDIKILLANLDPEVNQQEIDQLKAKGITQVAISKQLKMHAKTIIVDGSAAYVGSENLTTNSLDNNRELGIILHDAKLLNQLVKVVSYDWINR